jgi:hypothetical protein
MDNINDDNNSEVSNLDVEDELLLNSNNGMNNSLDDVSAEKH